MSIPSVAGFLRVLDIDLEASGFTVFVLEEVAVIATGEQKEEEVTVGKTVMLMPLMSSCRRT